MVKPHIIAACLLITALGNRSVGQTNPPQNRKQSLEIANNFYQTGLQLQQSGLFSQSAAAFDSAIKYNPQSPDVFFSQGSSYESMGQYSKALYAYSQAASLRPSFEGAQFRKAVCLYELGLYTRAIEQLDALLATGNSGEATHSVFYRTAPNGEVTISTDNQLHAEYFLYRGLSLAALDDHERAVADMDSAVLISRRAPDYLINRGLIFQRMGWETKAAGDYKEALRRDPENQVALANLFTVDATAAKGYLTQNAEITSDIVVPELLAQLGFDAYEKERYAEAAAYYNKALKLNPAEADWILNRALCYVKLNQLATAENELLRVVKMPDYPRKALLHLANVLFLTEKYEMAVSFYNQFIAIEPGYGSAYYNRGISFGKLGNTSAACRDLSTAHGLGVAASEKPLQLLCNN